MGDDDRRAASHQLSDGLFDLLFGLWIDASSGLVKHDQIGVAQPDPGKCQQLCLAGRQAGAAGAQRPVDAAVDQGLQTGLTQRRHHLVVGGRRIEHGDVVADRAREQFHLLRNQCHPVAQMA